jgi:hypothetical protein
LRVAVAEIALEYLLHFGVKPHGAERACGYAHPATDAAPIVDHHPVKKLIPVDGFLGADGHARSIFALLTTDGDIKAFMLAVDNPDSG